MAHGRHGFGYGFDQRERPRKIPDEILVVGDKDLFCKGLEPDDATGYCFPMIIAIIENGSTRNSTGKQGFQSVKRELGISGIALPRRDADLEHVDALQFVPDIAANYRLSDGSSRVREKHGPPALKTRRFGKVERRRTRPGQAA